MANQSHEDCKHLHDALESARARLNPPQRDTTIPGAQSAIVMDPRDTTPDAREDVHAEIAQLEQAIRDAGCEGHEAYVGDPRDFEATAPREREGGGRSVIDGREQREIMLGQMAEQREKLRSDGVDMPDEDDTIGEPVEEELGRMQERDRAMPRQDTR